MKSARRITILGCLTTIAIVAAGCAAESEDSTPAAESSDAIKSAGFCTVNGNVRAAPRTDSVVTGTINSNVPIRTANGDTYSVFYVECRAGDWLGGAENPAYRRTYMATKTVENFNDPKKGCFRGTTVDRRNQGTRYGVGSVNTFEKFLAELPTCN